VKSKETWLTRYITFGISGLDGMKYLLRLVVVRVGFIVGGASVRSYRSMGLGSRVSSIGLSDILLRSVLLVYYRIRTYKEALSDFVLLAKVVEILAEKGEASYEMVLGLDPLN
jgi:hypothetical protein